MGMPLEAGAGPPSFFPDEDFPPLGMRLAILDVFLLESTKVSSLDGELSLEDFPDLLLSSLSLGGAAVRPLLAEDLEKDEDGDEVLLGGLSEDGGVLLGVCLTAALLHTNPGGVAPSSPYSDRSSSSCRAISATDGDARDADLGLIRRNLSSMDL